MTTARRDRLIRFEGKRLALYRCSQGKLTIGVGHNIEDRGLPGPIVDALLDYDMAETAKDLYRRLPWLQHEPEGVQDALFDLSFNMGLPTLLTFKKMLAALEDGDYELARAELLDSEWARQVQRERRDEIADLIVSHWRAYQP